MSMIDTQLLPAATLEAPAEPTRVAGDRVRRRHWTTLIVSVLVIVLAYLLSIRTDGRVAFRFAPAHALPETCLIHGLFGFNCPGCGLTRSILCLARGQWQLSLAYHRLGWLMALMIVLQLPYRTLLLTRGRCPGVSATDARRLGYALVTAFILYWLLNLI
jgi:uncharacterized integral membrane protein